MFKRITPELLYDLYKRLLKNEGKSLKDLSEELGIREEMVMKALRLLVNNNLLSFHTSVISNPQIFNFKVKTIKNPIVNIVRKMLDKGLTAKYISIKLSISRQYVSLIKIQYEREKLYLK